MFKQYRYPLFVWLTVQGLATPLIYLVQYFRSDADLETFLFNLTFLNVVIGYFGSLLVCLPFYLIFWILYHQLITRSVKPIKLWMCISSQVLWWFSLIVVWNIHYSEMRFNDLLWAILPHAFLLLIAIFFYKTRLTKS